MKVSLARSKEEKKSGRPEQTEIEKQVGQSFVFVVMKITFTQINIYIIISIITKTTWFMDYILRHKSCQP